MSKKTQSPLASPARPLSNTTNELITSIIITKRNQTNSNLNSSIIENTLSDTDWVIATPKNNKRHSTKSPGLSSLNKHPSTESFFTTPNRYGNLDIEDDHNMETTESTEPIIHKPPPIFIKSDLNFLKFCTAIKLCCGTDDFTCKSNTSGIKLQLNTPDTFRKAVQLLKSKEVVFHIYQIKDEKVFRVVLRNLHQSIPLDFIKDELSKQGFKVKQKPISLKKPNLASSITPFIKQISKNTLPSNLRLLLNKKRNARSTWQNSRLPSDKKIFNHLSNLLKKELIKHKAKQYENYINSLEPTPISLWRATKKLTKIREIIPPLLTSNNLLASTDEEKSLIFAEHLANAFKPHQDIFPNPEHLSQDTKRVVSAFDIPQFENVSPSCSRDIFNYSGDSNNEHMFKRPKSNEIKHFFEFHPIQDFNKTEQQPFNYKKTFFRPDGSLRYWLTYNENKKYFFCSLCLAFAKKVEHRRMIFQRIVDVIKLIGKRGLSSRGAYESAKDLANPNVSYGNFLDILLLLAKYDAPLDEHIKLVIKKANDNKTPERSQNVTLLSKTLANYVIKSISILIKKQISEDIKMSGMYSIQIDTSQDVSVSDICSVIVRYGSSTYKSGVEPTTHERALSFLNPKKTTSQALCNLISNNLSAQQMVSSTIEFLKKEARHFEDILKAGKNFVKWANELIENEDEINNLIPDNLPNVRIRKKKTLYGENQNETVTETAIDLFKFNVHNTAMDTVMICKLEQRFAKHAEICSDFTCLDPRQFSKPLPTTALFKLSKDKLKLNLPKVYTSYRSDEENELSELDLECLQENEFEQNLCKTNKWCLNCFLWCFNVLFKYRLYVKAYNNSLLTNIFFYDRACPLRFNYVKNSLYTSYYLIYLGNSFTIERLEQQLKYVTSTIARSSFLSLLFVISGEFYLAQCKHVQVGSVLI
ncbi:hypothetical protein QTP88_020046 [Uroleucon formosanum]